ncbi:MAG: hypothetical protein IJ639_03645 [Ruminococcus sp.]|nr:hypothetical protein [Ruminococcus sp.]
MIIDSTIRADTARANLFEPIVIAEDDENSHRLVVKLIVDGTELLVDTNATPSPIDHIKLNFHRADGTVGTQSGSVSGGRLYFDLPGNMLELDDKVKCDISLSYPKTVRTHTISESAGEITVSETVKTAQASLRTALFCIDSQLRVMTES